MSKTTMSTFDIAMMIAIAFSLVVIALCSVMITVEEHNQKANELSPAAQEMIDYVKVTGHLPNYKN